MTMTKFERINEKCMEQDRMLQYERLIPALVREKCSIEEYMELLKKNKKILAVYGNCQALYLLQMLSRTDVIRQDFAFLNFRGVHRMKAFHYDLEKLKKCFGYLDVFIYQYVKADNSFGEELASDQMLQSLNPACKKVCVPNIFFKGYFPHYTRAKTRIYFDEERSYELEPVDGAVNQLIVEGDSVSLMIEKLGTEDYFSEDVCVKNMESSMRELILREERCDVRISDYIREYFVKKHLFYTPNHPTNIVQRELVCRILRKLGYQGFKVDMTGIAENDHLELFIFPSIKKNLGLEFKKDRFRLYKYIDLQFNGLEDYIAKYNALFQQKLNFSHEFQNLERTIVYNEKFVNKRGLCVMEYKNGYLHLSLYLNIKFHSRVNETVLSIPQLFAPRNPFMTTVMTIDMRESVCTITAAGDVKLNMDNSDGKAKTCIIDTCYIPKISI